MELSDVVRYTFFGTALLAGANWAEYEKTKKWLKEHPKTKENFHEDKMKQGGLIKKIDYCLLYPGRKMAYIEHSQNKR